MKAKINKDRVELTELRVQNSGSLNYYEIECEFDESWDGLTKEIVIAQETEGIHRAIINNKAYIDKEYSGRYTIGFVGYTIEDEVKTYQVSTNLVPIVMVKGAGEISIIGETVPTPTEWETYLKQIQDLIDDIEDMDISAVKVDGVTTITITQRDGTTQTVQILDGEKGDKGDTGDQGPKGDPGNTGATGNGIRSIQKTGTVGLVDTYTVYFTDGTTTTFTVTNGAGGGNVDDVKVNGTSVVSNKVANITVPIKTSQIQNDSNFVSDANYIHTDNNFTTSQKNKLADLENYDDTEVKQDIQALNSDVEGLGTSKQDKQDNNLQTNNKSIVPAINEVNSIAKGANQALSYGNYSTMITALNSLSKETYKTGQNIYINTLEVPDLWISSVEQTSQTYTYIDDASIINELVTNGYIQVGYYKLSMLETQKVDLTNYYNKTESDNKFVEKIAGKGLSTNDYDNTEKAKLAGAEQTSNKVTTISSGSTNAEYPSALAVYNYIQSLDANNVQY